MAKLLIVEDNDSILRLLSIMLESRGHTVHATKTGVSALRTMTAEKPDLVLLDIMLPDVDGFEICKQIKGNPETQSVPVVFVTARNQPLDKIHGQQVGGNAYIAKPFKSTSIVNQVNSLLH